jgi:cell wall-associated NlpC family hydrolase
MSWSNTYVGLPYADLGRDRDGLDCWGLVRLVYGEQLGIDLPDYSQAYVSAAERSEVQAVIDGGEASGEWTRVDAYRPFDLMVFRQGRLRCHVGLCFSQRLMLHIAQGHVSRLETFSAGHWSPRLTGVFRHRDQSHE